MSIVRHLAIPAVLVLALPGPRAAWAEAIDGTFLAVRACSAYVSKNKLTNPDGSRTIPGQQYRVIERNTPNNPSHYRIRLDTAHPQERWVDSGCGRFSAGSPPAPATGPGGSPDTGTGDSGIHCPAPAAGADSCEICGLGDGYVLALSWQPAFCESRKSDLADKPECRITDTSSYQARHFTLHGLWPNRTACGTHYGFCGSVRGKPDSFGDYPAVPLKDATRESLAEVMPSVAAGSGLERHEWHKHGTCSGFAPDEYFSLSADLTRQFNRSGMADFMAAHLGRTVTKREFYDRLDRALGAGTRDLVALDCGKGGKRLEEVTITLPAGIRAGADLKDLLRQARGGVPRSKCGDSFLIDPIGF